MFFMRKFFLPASISLFAVAIIVASLASTSLIKGVSKEKQLAEVKGESISITQSPTPTITPTSTIEINREPTVYIQPAVKYIEPTSTPIPTPTIQSANQPAYSNYQDKQAYCRDVAAEVVRKIASDPEMRKDLQWIQGEVGSDVTKYLNDSTYTNAYQTCLGKVPQQVSTQQTQVSAESNNNSVYEPPKDSQGNLCWATASRCKYECNDADGWIDVWVDNIKFYVDSSNFTTDPEKLQYYKDEIAIRVAKLTDSCGEAKVRQWVQ